MDRDGRSVVAAILVPVTPVASREVGERIPFRMWAIRCDVCGALSPAVADRQRDAIEFAGDDGWSVVVSGSRVTAACDRCRALPGVDELVDELDPVDGDDG